MGNDAIDRGVMTGVSEVVIARPIAEVYPFYRDIRNVTAFATNVTELEALPDGRWRWTVLGPNGVRIDWTISQEEDASGRQINYRTNDTATWQISFAEGDDLGSTIVRVSATDPGAALSLAVLSLVGWDPGADVRRSLPRLKRLLEGGDPG